MKKDITISQVFGSGLALILIALLIFLLTEKILFLHTAIGLTVLSMIWQAPFRYFGIAWFVFGEALGFVVSRILLTLIYVVLVIPIGLLKRGTIRKNMKLGQFKKGTDAET